jgi:hypothetical protein
LAVGENRPKVFVRRKEEQTIPNLTNNDATGAYMVTLLDQDIAHIVRVMRPSLSGDLSGPILPAEYWRRRLYRLLDSRHLTKVQLCSIDDLLRQLDQFNAEQRV